MSQEAESLQRLQDLVKQTKALYEGATRNLTLAKSQDDLGAGHPDGSVRHAIRVERHLFEIYMRALNDLNRFILDKETSENKPR